MEKAHRNVHNPGRTVHDNTHSPDTRMLKESAQNTPRSLAALPESPPCGMLRSLPMEKITQGPGEKRSH